MAEMGDRISALVDYVKQHFPGHDVWDTRDHDQAVTVTVRVTNGFLLLTASSEFLRDPPAAVTKRLTEWEVADALRYAGRTERLRVTRAGWRVTGR